MHRRVSLHCSLSVNFGLCVEDFSHCSCPGWRKGRGYEIPHSAANSSIVKHLSGIRHQVTIQNAPHMHVCNGEEKGPGYSTSRKSLKRDLVASTHVRMQNSSAAFHVQAVTCLCLESLSPPILVPCW